MSETNNLKVFIYSAIPFVVIAVVFVLVCYCCGIQEWLRDCFVPFVANRAKAMPAPAGPGSIQQPSQTRQHPQLPPMGIHGPATMAQQQPLPQNSAAPGNFGQPGVLPSTWFRAPQTSTTQSVNQYAQQPPRPNSFL